MKYIIKTIAILFFVLSSLLILIAINTQTISWIWVFGIIFSIIGAYLFKKSKFLGQKKGEEALQLDKRDPILYLRSFLHDPIATKADNDFLLAKVFSFGPPQPLNSEEEQISFAVNHFGPFIAIGDPKEAIPKLGASRIYTEHWKWKDVVIDLIRRSQLVILRVGETPGFWWEVSAVLHNKEPEKIMFLLPDSLQKFNEFKKTMESKFSLILPKNYKPRYNPYQTFSAVLIFNSDSEPSIIYCKDKGNLYWYNGLKKDFKDIIQNILERSNNQSFNHFVKSRANYERVGISIYQRYQLILLGGVIIFFIFKDFVEINTGIQIEEDSLPYFISLFICSIIAYIFIKVIEKKWTK